MNESETLPRLVLYDCGFTLFLCCQVLDQLVCFLTVIFSEACFHFLALTLYPNLFCHLYLCPDLSFNLSIVFGSWLASLFLQVSSLVTKIKDLMSNPVLPLPALLGKTFSCCVSYCLVEVTICFNCQKCEIPLPHFRSAMTAK